MEFTVEGRDFLACAVDVHVLAVSDGRAAAQGQIISLADANRRLQLPRGEKRWQRIAVRFANGVEAQLPLPSSCPIAPGDNLKLGCLGPAAPAAGSSGGNGAVMEVYAVSDVASAWKHEFLDAAAMMKCCGVTRATDYEAEPYPLKKVCKVSGIIFLVGLVCFSFLMHLFTESMDELVRRLPEALYMSAKFGGIAALVVAAGGGLYMKSSNDYNHKKKLDAYLRQFEQAMTSALAQPSA